MNKNKCVTCGTILQLGGFAYNQDTCFECFKKEVLLMRERINQYPSWLWEKREEHKDILAWMMGVVAEIYGVKQ